MTLRLFHSKKTGITGIIAAMILMLGFAVYSADAAYAAGPVSVPVKVSYEGQSLPTETFTVEISGDSLDTPIKKSVDLSQQKKSEQINFDLGDLSLGIYEYRIRQIKGNIAGITYDTREYDYYVMVNNDGSIEQRAVNRDDPSDKPDMISFVNSYNSSKDKVLGDPPVKIKKLITGKKPKEVSDFIFVLKAEGNTAGLDKNPMPEGYGDGPVEVTVTGDGEVEIGYMTFHKEGEYRYRVTEKDTRIEGYDYDDAVFDVTYTVTRNHSSGKLECERQVVKNRTEIVTGEYCEFDNMYEGNPAQKFKRAVKTGDPFVMFPLTLSMVACIVVVALLMSRRKKDE